MPSVDRRQRYTKARRCPVCGGAELDPRGKGKRCTGYLSPDGEWARCSREEHAGSLDLEASSETYVHKMHGACKCGTEHGAAKPSTNEPEATYDYVDEAGDLLFQVVRFPGKQFRQRRPGTNGHGPWIWKLDDTRRVLYRLPQLLASTDPVWIVEGERDVETLRKLGLTATTNPHGAGKWHVVAEQAREILKSRNVTIIADADDKGFAHARDVAAALPGARVLRCPKHKDVTDHLGAGGTLDELVPLDEPPDDAETERAAIEAESSVRVTDDWPEPYLFDSFQLPPFPVDSLSPWMRDWAAAEALATQTPVDLPASLALAVASLAIARCFHVQVRPGWLEPCNLWMVVAMPPGERKSPVYTDATRPIYAYSKHVADKLGPQIAARSFERRVIEGEIKSAEASAIKGKSVGGVDAHDHARQLRLRLDGLPELRAPVLLTDDCTSEALAVLLSQQSERIGIFSAEGGPLELMAGRYTERGSNFEIFLKAHPGDPHVVHRISREPISLTHPLLTMALTVQPSVIAGLASKDGFRGRGLLARFFYSLPSTLLGGRQTDPWPVPEPVELAYNEAVVSLLLREVKIGDARVSLSDEADRARSAYQLEIEPRLGIDGDLHIIGDWANKLVGGVARLAGVLHVADHATCLARLPETIPAPTWTRAEALGRYLLEHARAAFSTMGADETESLAKRILSWCRRKQARTWTAREARRALHATAEDMTLAAACLLDRGLIREHKSERPSTVTAGRPSTTYDTHPSIFGTFGTSPTPSQKSKEEEEDRDFFLSH